MFREIFFTAPRARCGVFSSTLQSKPNVKYSPYTYSNVTGDTRHWFGGVWGGRRVDGDTAVTLRSPIH